MKRGRKPPTPLEKLQKSKKYIKGLRERVKPGCDQKKANFLFRVYVHTQCLLKSDITVGDIASRSPLARLSCERDKNGSPGKSKAPTRQETARRLCIKGALLIKKIVVV